MELGDAIAQGLHQLGLQPDADVTEKAVSFIQLLERWNRVTNLTAIRDPMEMVSHHLMDSFAVQPWITGHTILDAGSGGGLPGIALALINADKDFILLDSNGKKTRFMVQAKVELGLDNVTVVQSRIEDHTDRYDQVISRAFASLPDFIRLAAPLLNRGGSLLAMKGPDQINEMAAVEETEFMVDIHELVVPGLARERFLVQLKAGDTTVL